MSSTGYRLQVTEKSINGLSTAHCLLFTAHSEGGSL